MKYSEIINFLNDETKNSVEKYKLLNKTNTYLETYVLDNIFYNRLDLNDLKIPNIQNVFRVLKRLFLSHQSTDTSYNIPDLCVELPDQVLIQLMKRENLPRKRQEIKKQKCTRLIRHYLTKYDEPDEPDEPGNKYERLLSDCTEGRSVMFSKYKNDMKILKDEYLKAFDKCNDKATMYEDKISGLTKRIQILESKIIFLKSKAM